MFFKAGVRFLVLTLVLAACSGPALAQSTRNQGPPTSQSQSYSNPGPNGPFSIATLLLTMGLVAAAGVSAGYWMTHRRE